MAAHAFFFPAPPLYLFFSPGILFSSFLCFPYCCPLSQHRFLHLLHPLFTFHRGWFLFQTTIEMKQWQHKVTSFSPVSFKQIQNTIWWWTPHSQHWVTRKDWSSMGRTHSWVLKSPAEGQVCGPPAGGSTRKSWSSTKGEAQLIHNRTNCTHKWRFPLSTLVDRDSAWSQYQPKIVILYVH